MDTPNNLFSGGLFGQFSTSSTSSTGGLFGSITSQPVATSGGLFASVLSTSAPNGGLFSSAATVSNLFGQSFSTSTSTPFIQEDDSDVLFDVVPLSDGDEPDAQSDSDASKDSGCQSNYGHNDPSTVKSELSNVAFAGLFPVSTSNQSVTSTLFQTPTCSDSNFRGPAASSKLESVSSSSVSLFPQLSSGSNNQPMKSTMSLFTNDSSSNTFNKPLFSSVVTKPLAIKSAESNDSKIQSSSNLFTANKDSTVSLFPTSSQPLLFTQAANSSHGLFSTSSDANKIAPCSQSVKTEPQLSIDTQVKKLNVVSPSKNIPTSPVNKVSSNKLFLQRRLSKESGAIKSPNTRTSIKILNIPSEFNNKSFVLKHFQKFGNVIRIFCNTTHGTATIHFNDHAAAANAKENGRVLSPNGPKVDIVFGSYQRRSSGDLPMIAPTPHIKTSPSTSPRTSPTLPYKTSPVQELAIVKRKRITEKPSKDVRQSGSSSINSVASCLGDKITILDNRDRLLRAKRAPSRELSQATALLATCPDMCSEKERYVRESGHNISVYECCPSNPHQVDPCRVVKEYSRSSADQEEPLPIELRPPAVLDRTMVYLLAAIGDQAEEKEAAGGQGGWGRWFEFLWSRTRALRKDITQQQLCEPIAVAILEKITRFHIYCGERLCEEDVHSFDTKINNENLTKCLQSLRELYHDMLSRHQTHCPNEPEFRAYMILMKVDDDSILNEVQQLSPDLRSSVQVRHAMSVYYAINTYNYIRFFKLVERSDYLTACLLHRFFTQVRRKALTIMVRAYTPPTHFPLRVLVDHLKFESESEASDFCDHLCLTVTEEYVLFNRIAPQESDFPWKPKRSIRLVESKRQDRKVGEVINGDPLPDPNTLLLPVQDSFDSSGRYVGLLSSSHPSADIFQSPAKLPSVDIFQSPSKLPSSISRTVEATGRPEIPALSFTAEEEIRNRLLTNNVLNELVPEFVSEAVNPDIRKVAYSEWFLHESSLSILSDTTDSVVKQLIAPIASQCISEALAVTQATSDIFCELLSEVILEKVKALINQVIVECQEENRQTMDRAIYDIFDDLISDLFVEVGHEEMAICQIKISLAPEVQTSLLNSVVQSECREIAASQCHARLRLRRAFCLWRSRHQSLRLFQDAILHLPAHPPVEDNFLLAETLCGPGAIEARIGKRQRLNQKTLDEVNFTTTWRTFKPAPPEPLDWPYLAIWMPSEDPPELHHWLRVKCSSFPRLSLHTSLNDLVHKVAEGSRAVVAILVVNGVGIPRFNDIIGVNHTELRVAPVVVLNCDSLFCQHLTSPAFSSATGLVVSNLHSVFLPLSSHPLPEWSLLLDPALVWLVTQAERLNSRLQASQSLPRDTHAFTRVGEIVDRYLQRHFYKPVADNLMVRQNRGLLHHSPKVLIDIYNRAIDRLSVLFPSLCSSLHLSYPHNDITDHISWSDGLHLLSCWLENLDLPSTSDLEIKSLVYRYQREFDRLLRRWGGRGCLDPPFADNLPWTEIVIAAVDGRLERDCVSSQLTQVLVQVKENWIERAEWNLLDDLLKDQVVVKEALAPNMSVHEPTLIQTLEIAAQQSRRDHLSTSISEMFDASFTSPPKTQGHNPGQRGSSASRRCHQMESSCLEDVNHSMERIHEELEAMKSSLLDISVHYPLPDSTTRET